MKKIIIAVLVCFVSTGLYAQNCQSDSMGNTLCAPPNGTAIKNIIGQILCAPGQCIRTISGDYECSSVQGGAAVENIIHQVKCYGGECIEPTQQMCQKL